MLIRFIAHQSMSTLFTGDYIYQSGLTGGQPEESDARFCLVSNMDAALCSVTEVQGKHGLVNVTQMLKDTPVVGKYISMSVRVLEGMHCLFILCLRSCSLK